MVERLILLNNGFWVKEIPPPKMSVKLAKGGSVVIKLLPLMINPPPNEIRLGKLGRTGSIVP